MRWTGRSFRATVTDGALDITLTEDDASAGDTNAALKGVEVLEYVDGCLSDAECDDGAPCTDDICNAQHECTNPPGGLDRDGDGTCDARDVCPDDGLDDADDDGDGRGNACDQCVLAAGAAEDAYLGTGLWKSRAANQVSRSEAGLAAVGGKLYLIGGEQPAAGRSVEVYDVSTDTWAAGPQLPEIGVDGLGRNHIQPVVVGSKIFVFGGLTTTFREIIGEVLVLDTNDLGSGWQPRAPMPTPRGSVACAARGALVYCAGGVVDGAGGVDPAVATLEIYNTISDTWTAGPSMPRVRDSAYAHFVGDDFVLVSGRDTFTNNVVPFTDIYDTSTGSWRERAPPPQARGGYASAVLEGRVLVISGELAAGAGGTPTGLLPVVHEYDPARNLWRDLVDIPTPRHGFMGAVTTDAAGKRQVHTISGGPVQGFVDSTEHERFFFGDCSADLDCDDGLFCNGAETCYPASGCTSSPLAGLDDGVDCSIDSCDESMLIVTHTPDDSRCNDGAFFNGTEICRVLRMHRQYRARLRVSR